MSATTGHRFADLYKCGPSMRAGSVNLESLFDADEYHRSGHCPWTFFAYPTSLAVEDGLPPDAEACRLLAEIQTRGMEVAIWRHGIDSHTTYFACKQDDIDRLRRLLRELEGGTYGKNFCAERSEAQFARLEHGS